MMQDNVRLQRRLGMHAEPEPSAPSTRNATESKSAHMTLLYRSRLSPVLTRPSDACSTDSLL